MDADILEINSRCKTGDFQTEKISTRYASAMESWDQRLRGRLAELGWSPAELARQMGRGADSAFLERLRKIIKGGVKQPRGNLMEEIAATVGMPINFLRYGRFDTPDAHIESSEVATGAGRVVTAPPKGTHAIPELVARAGLGGGGVATEEVRRDGQYADPIKPEGWSFPSQFVQQDLRAPAGSLLVLESEGDSMFPTIASGERLIVNTRHREPSPDGIYAIRDAFGGIIAKRLQVLRSMDPPRLRIISDNPNHIAEEVPLDGIEIVGRVIWGLKRF